MSEVILDTITGKSTATTITIGSTPVVSASANSMTIRGEGSNQTSIQQGLAKQWISATNTTVNDSLNTSSISDGGDWLNINYTTNMANDDYAAATGGSQSNYATNRGTAIGVADVATNTRKEYPMTEAEAGYAGGAYAIHTSTMHGDLA